MNKHERFAKREWEWLFQDGYRPSEYAFEVSVLAHAKEKHYAIYREKLAAARAKYEVVEPEVEYEEILEAAEIAEEIEVDEPEEE